MTTEFNLSEKIETNIVMGYGDGCSCCSKDDMQFVRLEDVKEFIRLLKEEAFEIVHSSDERTNCMMKVISIYQLDKLAGDKLI